MWMAFTTTRLKKDNSNFKAALYSPNQSDFSRGVDVSISKPPSAIELRAARNRY